MSVAAGYSPRDKPARPGLQPVQLEVRRDESKHTKDAVRTAFDRICPQAKAAGT